jgi:hypothetical protein
LTTGEKRELAQLRRDKRRLEVENEILKRALRIRAWSRGSSVGALAAGGEEHAESVKLWWPWARRRAFSMSRLIASVPPLDSPAVSK